MKTKDVPCFESCFTELNFEIILPSFVNFNFLSRKNVFYW